MARNNVQTSVTVGMNVQLAKRNAEALKEVIVTLKKELKEQRAIMENPINVEAYTKAEEAVKKLTMQIQTLQKVQKSATPASAYESFVSGDAMNSNTLRQAQRGAKNRLNTVRTDEGDAAARQFINDSNAIQKQLNRLQAGFTSPFRTIKQELNKLSGGELQRLHQLLQQEQPLVKGNEKAWANYSAAIAKVEERMRQYDTAARQKAGAATLSQSQSGGFAQANERDIQRAIDKLKEYRAVINDPSGTGKGTYEATNAEIGKLQANLDALKQKALQAGGQGMMPLATALQTGLQTINGSFEGTTQQLTQAKQALEDNLQTAKRGSAEYNNIKRALNGVELELQRTGTLSKEVQAVLDQPKGKSFNALKQAVEQGRAALNSMDRTTKEGQKAFDDLAKKVKQADIEMKNLAGTSKGTASAFDKAWSRLKTYVGLYVGAAVAMQKITATMGDLMELSDKMGEVRKTTGFTADEVGRLTTELKKLDTRSTITELLNLSAAAGQLGLKTQEEIQGFTEAANQLVVALPEMGRESATSLMKIANATGDLEKNGGNVRETMERIGSTIIALRANSASAAPQITDFVSRVGAVGAQAGISIDQIAALGSTIDALGGRVEMSATALSRMIPAIRNNSFAIAYSIGVTESYLKSLAPMQQMVLIFQKMRDNIKGIDTTTAEGQEQMAQNIEQLLGKNATMREVMKDLEQQGARAGIVFGLLSQNVDELEKQLGIASNAYRENTALMNEYNNMNETTAAKWQRLKNQFEEMFVGDGAQRFLGGIIDGLRGIVELLSGPLLGAFHGVLVGFSAFKIGVGALAWKFVIEPLKLAITNVHSLGTSVKRLAATWRTAWRSMDAATKANWIMAIGSVIYMLGKRAIESATKVNELDQALAKLDNAEAEAERNLNRLVGSMSASAAKTEEARKKQAELEGQTKTLREAVEKLRGSKDKSTETTERLNQKEDELKESEKKLKEATDETNKANDERLKLINEFNSKYSTYLGYLLDEKTATEQVALAHMQVVAALKEELEQKRLNRQTESVDQEYNEKIDKAGAQSKSALSTLPADMQRRIESQWNTIRGRIQYNVDENGRATYTLPSIEGLGNKAKTSSDYAGLRNDLEALFLNIVRKEVENAGTVTDRNGNPIPLNFGTRKVQIGTSSTGIAVYGDVPITLEDFAHQAFLHFNRWTDLTMQREQAIDDLRRESENYAKGIHANAVEAANTMNADAYERITATLGEITGNQALSSETVGTLAQQANIITANLTKYKNELKDADKFIGRDNEASLENAVNTLYASLTEAQRKQIIAAAKVAQSSGGGGGGNGSTNPYGNYNPVLSPYEDWNADALVARRKEMLERVRALAAGADVQAVLSEDAKFITEATRQNIQTTEEAIEWYNRERLQIQKALKGKHLTNTGDWRDDKEGGGKKPQFPESDYALAELDRYYSHRKQLLEKAREEENMTEELYNREVELLEQEHLAKRSKLRETFTSKDRKEIEQFRQWWATLAETGDLAEVPWATVESEWAKATDAQWGANNRKAQEDLTKMQGITVKHLNAIAKIIDKERPYDAITANLRDNLTKMDILFADYQKNGPTEDTSVLVKAGTERLKFLLGEAETAYTSTVEDVLRRMGEAGMTAWADEIRKSPAMQNALMAQLQTAYDEIQNAIKKEASLIKKQTDIWWNDIAAGQTQSRKGAFEKAISDMGLLGDQVKRANSLIGAGAASERVADKLTIKQMQLRLQMQQVYYDQMRKMWADRVASLRAQGKEIDAQHAEISRNLSLAEEQKKLDEQRVAIANQLEESNNRLYTELRGWAELLSSSLQSVFEASNAGNAEYYNELAKLNLTGKGGPGAGAYMVIDNAGTSDATAHYEYLDERAALDRQHEIEQQNAVAEAWKKVMDDINKKMSETITDQLNAMLLSASVDANTDALVSNTIALGRFSEQLEQGISVNVSQGGVDMQSVGEGGQPMARAQLRRMGVPAGEGQTQEISDPMTAAQVEIEASRTTTQEILTNQQTVQQGVQKTNKEMVTGTQSAFAKMTAAANLYGVAYQTMSNENLTATQKFEMMALQAVGNYVIGALTTEMAAASAKAATDSPGVLGTLWKQLGWAAAPVFAIFTGLLGGLMGLATSKISKAKSTIAQATGASVSAGRLATGMLTYAEGNVNEFTDPSTLTPGRQYNVDAADGKTYRARYMGNNPRTHLTNGPEFHLSGERGREMIIDAGTTRQITMNEAEIWHAIQTLSGGGRISALRRQRKGRGVSAFAEGNVDDFESYETYGTNGTNGMSAEQTAALQASLDRNSAIMERLADEGIEAYVSPYGKRGIVNGYDTYKKEAKRHGINYIP